MCRRRVSDHTTNSLAPPAYVNVVTSVSATVQSGASASAGSKNATQPVVNNNAVNGTESQPRPSTYRDLTVIDNDLYR